MYRVLIADDEDIIREGIKCLIDWNALGYEITDEASNGQMALTKILAHHPDVVLMDISMPEMSGLEVISNAISQGFSGKVIIISGYSDFKYAKDAIKYGVQYYITKPIDEDELLEILTNIKGMLDEELRINDAAKHYLQMAKEPILRELMEGSLDFAHINPDVLKLSADVYQVVICEKYGHSISDASYRFSELLRVTNQDNNSYDSVTIQNNEVVLLKGGFAIKRFNEFLLRYERETLPQKDSPLDSLFISYGSCVDDIRKVNLSYNEANALLGRRFFCEHNQHTIGYQALSQLSGSKPILTKELLDEYSKILLDNLQAFNRNALALSLGDLQKKLCNASDSIEDIKLFLADLFLRIKEQLGRLYSAQAIPFAQNSDIIRSISEKYYLYEIILYFTEQFDNIMFSLGNSTKDSVLDDILSYISHNYAGNITLENIAPLFGYNSSYLGKIFSRKMGESFNSYVDHVRIEKAKELLLEDDTKIYQIAERTGYRNVDYFHIKFKKYVGVSPQKYRKEHKK